MRPVSPVVERKQKQKILLVHCRYLQSGGEDSVFDAEADLLRNHGHAVELYVRDNKEISDQAKIRVAMETFWSEKTIRDIQRIHERFRPDVIHVHNTFPVVSPSVYWIASRLGVPIVQTLHNYRLLCAQATLLRNGRVCEDCVGKLPLRGILRRCYHDSASQSAVLVGMLGLHRVLGTYRSKVTRYIALTDFSRTKFIEGGLPGERIVIKPNFVNLPCPPEAPRKGGLFVGRLSEEKGIGTLCDALQLRPDAVLDVIGSGPLEDRMNGQPGVRLGGWLHPEAIYQAMRRRAYLVLPSIWYENFPRTLVEAFACGLPVIASRLGALEELVADRRTGLLFDPGSSVDLAEKIAWAERNPRLMREMGAAARAEYEQKYTPLRNYEQLMGIYRDAITSMRDDSTVLSTTAA